MILKSCSSMLHHAPTGKKLGMRNAEHISFWTGSAGPGSAMRTLWRGAGVAWAQGEPWHSRSDLHGVKD